MKKRILCIVMLFVMIVPFILASCGEDDKDKMKEIILGGEDEEIDRALTLSLWLPTDTITIEGKTADLGELSQQEKIQLSTEYPDVYEFLKRVDAVEDEINKVLISRNYYTNIDIVPINNEFYEKAIADRFAKMDAETDPFQMNAKGDSDDYANEVVEETVGNNVLYNLLYRPVDKNQLDLFIIRDYGEYNGYDMYREYIEKGYLLPLNKTTDANETDKFPKTGYISNSGTYSSINKLIREEFMSQMKVNDLIYALPNNHLYSSQKFYAIDKKLFAELGGEFNVKDFADFSKLAEYINAVNKLENDKLVPLFAENGIPAFELVDLDNLTYGDDAANKILYDEKFVNYVKTYKALEENGAVKSALADGETAAVKIFEGTNVEQINAMSKDYYLVAAGEKSISSSEMYSSMLAISTFTLDYERSMKMLNLLISDTQIVTLLQYGIENEDYSVATEMRNGKEVEVLNLNKDTAYVMNNLYTGSSYYTYPHAGAALNDWDAVKTANLYGDVSKYANIEYFISKANLSEDDLHTLENREQMKELAILAFAEISAMTSAEFDAFIEEINKEEIVVSSYESLSDSLKFAYQDYYGEFIEIYEKAMK